MVDRFSKLTRVTPLDHEDAKTVVSVVLDSLVAASASPDALPTNNRPQLRSVHFRGVLSMLGIRRVTSITYRPQTKCQVERFNRTIVARLRTYVEDHQDRRDQLVAVLTVAYNSRPQESTGVAPL